MRTPDEILAACEWAERLAASATLPGREPVALPVSADLPPQHSAVVYLMVHGGTESAHVASFLSGGDADLYAHSRTLLPSLARDARDLVAEVGALRADAAHWRGQYEASFRSVGQLVKRCEEAEAVRDEARSALVTARQSGREDAARACDEEAERISDGEGHLGLGIDAARTAARCASLIRDLPPHTGTTPEETKIP